MPTTRCATLLPHVLGGVAAAALGTVPLHRLPRPVRVGYVLVPAVLATGITFLSLRARDAPEDAELSAGTGSEDAAMTTPVEGGDPRPWIGWLGLSLGLGAIAAGASAAGIRIDHRVEDALRSRGVRAPRLVMGAATGALTVAVTVLDDSEG